MKLITGDSGNDTLSGKKKADHIFGLGGDDELFGRAGNDMVEGGEGNDVVNGESGDDVLFGGAGNDILTGGLGRDFMTGGGGADTFRFDDQDSGDATAGPLSDVIYDFTADDVLDLMDVDVLRFAGWGNDAPGRGSFSIWEGGGSTYVSWNTFNEVHDVELVGYSGSDLYSQIWWYDDDYRGNLNTTASIDSGQTRTGTLEVAEDDDWFRITLDEDRIYDFTLSGDASGGDAVQNRYLALRDADGNYVADAYADGANDAHMSYYAENPGTYYVAADSWSGDVGDYELGVTSYAYVDDYGGDTSTNGEIAAGETRTGELGHAGDTDWFRTELAEGDSYVFELHGADSGSGTLPDPVLVLYDAQGNFIDYNDDWSNLDSHLEHTAAATGTYFLAAYGYSYDHTGTYEMSAALIEDPLLV